MNQFNRPNNQSYYSWVLGSDILSNNATSVFTPQETTTYTLNYNDAGLYNICPI